MSYSYDPNQNPRSGASGPSGGNANAGQNYGQGYGQQGANQGFGQPYDDEETVAYPPQAGYPAQGYAQSYPAQGGDASQYASQYTQAADANAPVVVPARTTGRNWLPYLVVGIVLVALVCCVLPLAVLIHNGIIVPPGTPTVTPSPAVGQLVYHTTFAPADNRWPSTGGCSIQNNAYSITNNSTCIATVSPPNDESIVATVAQTSGPLNLPHGIALRRADPNDYYVFGITSDGSWVFIRYAVNKTPQTLKRFTASSAIKTGLNVTNTLEVRARGSDFYLYINGANVGLVSDNAYASGLPGLTGNLGATVVYTSFTISKLA